MESSKDRLLKAINHVEPETVPVSIVAFDDVDRWLTRFDARDNVELRLKLGLDIHTGLAVYTGGNTARGLDIWGCDADVMGARGTGYGTTRSHLPLAGAATVSDVDRCPWPDPDDFDYEVAARVLRTLPTDTARWVKAAYGPLLENRSTVEAARGGGPWMPVLCTVFNMMGMERALVAMHSEPAIVEAAIAHVEEFLLEYSRRLIRATGGLADVFYLGDDFAGQTGMLLSPEAWRRFLKPAYRKIIGLARSHGLKVWFHSCGTFRPVMPDLIDLGIDVWETVQAHLPGNEPEFLKREYGRHIAFFGGISTQQTLPFGSPDQVRAEVRERIRVLGEGGGYICGGDHTIMPETPIENAQAMIDEAKRYRRAERQVPPRI